MIIFSTSFLRGVKTRNTIQQGTGYSDSQQYMFIVFIEPTSSVTNNRWRACWPLVNVQTFWCLRSESMQTGTN